MFSLSSWHHFNMNDNLPHHALNELECGPSLRRRHINLTSEKRLQTLKSLECSFVRFKNGARVICGMTLLASNINTWSTKYLPRDFWKNFVIPETSLIDDFKSAISTNVCAWPRGQEWNRRENRRTTFWEPLSEKQSFLLKTAAQ